MSSRVLTVMFTDIKGFTDRTSSTSREQLVALLDAHEKLLLPIVQQFKGQLIKTIGDALLLTFESPTNAVLCAMLMQQTLRDFNLELTENDQEADAINIRIAINSGEVEERSGDIYGEAVNIAARIEGITEADEIYFTEAVYLAMNKAEVPSSEVGKRRLKGIPEAIKVYRVIQDPNSDDYQSLMQKLMGVNVADSGSMSPLSKSAQHHSSAFEKTTTSSNKKRTLFWLWLMAVFVFLGLAVGIFYSNYDPLKRPIADIEASITNNDYGLAYAAADKLFSQQPEEARIHDLIYKITDSENAQLLATEQFSKALDKLQAAQQKRPYLNVDELRKRTIWQQVETIYPKNVFIRKELAPLLNEFPYDAELLKKIIKLMGFGNNKGGDYGKVAAILLAKHHELELTEQEGLTLLEAMSYESAERPEAEELRKLVATRYPQGFDQAKVWLEKGIYDERLNSYLLLQEYGKRMASLMIN